MRRTVASLVVLVAFAAALALPAGRAAAHPHVWIDMRSTVLFDEAGRVEAVRLRWAFDEFYTLFVVEELALERGGGEIPPDDLQRLAEQDVANIAAYSYFTFVEVAGIPVPYGDARDILGTVEDGQLVVAFTVPLAEPADPLLQSVTYASYDPTYYVSILHEEQDDAVTLAGAPVAQCRAAIREPNPSPEIVTFAAALDRTQSAGDGLGVLFAETVEIRCE